MNFPLRFTSHCSLSVAISIPVKACTRKSHCNTHTVCHTSSLKLNFVTSNHAQTLTPSCFLVMFALWLTLEYESGSQQSKGVRSPICQNCEYVSVCNYAGRSFSLSVAKNGEPFFFVGTALATGSDEIGRGRDRGKEGAREECKLQPGSPAC